MPVSYCQERMAQEAGLMPALPPQLYPRTNPENPLVSGDAGKGWGRVIRKPGHLPPFQTHIVSGGSDAAFAFKQNPQRWAIQPNKNITVLGGLVSRLGCTL